MFLYRLLICTVVTLVSVGSLLAQGSPRNESAASVLPPYVMMVDDEDDSLVTFIPDSLFNTIAGQATFKVGRTVLDTNSPFIRELRDSVLPTVNAEGMSLVGIDLRGAASPEGGYANNVRLSRGRAAALERYIAERLDSIDVASLTHTRCIAEDYPYLLWLMEQAGDPDAEIVRDIIERCTIDRPQLIKAELKQVDGGKLWLKVLLDYFPTLRNARVVLWFKEAVKRQAIAPEQILELPVEPMDVAVTVKEPVLPVLQAPVERRHALSLSSNLLYDVMWMPNYGWAPMINLGAEWFPRWSNWTLRAGFTFPYYHRWSVHKFFQIRDYHLEARRYFNPGWLNTGLYAAAYVNATKYGIGFSAKKGWQGEGIGGALKIGYVVPLGSGRWRMDFHAAVGGYYTCYDPYVYGNPVTGEVDDDYYYDWVGGTDSFQKRAHTRWWVGPTELGVTLSYDILYYRSQGGASVLRKEVMP